MTNRFETCVVFVLAHECVFKHNGLAVVEHDPNDPGGTTFCGIDQRSHPGIDIAALTMGDAKRIYRLEEWTKCRCELLKPAWDLALFDTAVNIGAHRAVKLLQAAVDAKVDGFIGPVTIAAVNRAALDVLGEFIDLRESYYRSLPENLKTHYLAGWLNRLTDLRAACRLNETPVLQPS